MCKMDKIAASEIAFTPIVSKNYLADVDQVLEIIKASGLEYKVGDLTTFVRGANGKIFRLVEEIYQAMDQQTQFSMDIKISNICGCD